MQQTLEQGLKKHAQLCWLDEKHLLRCIFDIHSVNTDETSVTHIEEFENFNRVKVMRVNGLIRKEEVVPPATVWGM